jgi:hypothetical protein
MCTEYIVDNCPPFNSPSSGGFQSLRTERESLVLSPPLCVAAGAGHGRERLRLGLKAASLQEAAGREKVDYGWVEAGETTRKPI